MELEEIPMSEMKATTDDSKPAGFVSEDCCESASTDAIKGVESEYGKEIRWAFFPPGARRRTVCLYLHPEYSFVAK